MLKYKMQEYTIASNRTTAVHLNPMLAQGL